VAEIVALPEAVFRSCPECFPTRPGRGRSVRFDLNIQIAGTQQPSGKQIVLPAQQAFSSGSPSSRGE